MTNDPYEREAAKAAIHTLQRENQRLRDRVEQLEAAAARLKQAKGRYLTEQAANHLFSLLP
jgi:cell division septum initiation protein DivIVA